MFIRQRLQVALKCYENQFICNVLRRKIYIWLYFIVRSIANFSHAKQNKTLTRYNLYVAIHMLIIGFHDKFSFIHYRHHTSVCKNFPSPPADDKLLKKHLFFAFTDY